MRLRVDGQLQHLSFLTGSEMRAATSRLKVMAGLNISERRRPQDGRAGVTLRGRKLDLRLSTLPTQYGESVAIRILDQSRAALEWAHLGFGPDRIADIARILRQPSGIFLLAGPMGSGKTTTLYTALSDLNETSRKIVTIEDPIEYALPGVNQVQVQPGIDMTFAAALRAVLRQDADVVMVGEIRDQETAEIAVRAALMGRLVLSTLHASSSHAAIDRLTDLGVPSYLLAATLRGVLSQRLVRRLCTRCRGEGCPSCDDTGYHGRLVISELLEASPEITNAIAGGANATELLRTSRAAGFRSLAEDGQARAAAGETSHTEVRRVTGKAPPLALSTPAGSANRGDMDAQPS